ncbi:MAG: RNA polymerase sigma factor [Chloroflexi bacterium]|nr:RNA polymerase sigma factor [Chloroflexota bacterium]
MVDRSNQEWLDALRVTSSEAQNEALNDLRDLVLRAIVIYLSRRRASLRGWTRERVRELAEDLTQETILDIRAGLDSFRGEAKFTTWAYRFAINRTASELRRHRYRDISLDQLRDEEKHVFQRVLQTSAQVAGEDIERLVVQRYYIKLCKEIIETELNERQRLALVGVLVEGRSMDEVAAALQLNRNALYKLLHDARKKLQAQLRARHLSKGDVLAAFQE